MLATVIRAGDTARLYLNPLGDGVWEVANVVPSGSVRDPDIARLAGRRVAAAVVLAWAVGAISSADLCTCTASDLSSVPSVSGVSHGRPVGCASSSATDRIEAPGNVQVDTAT